jgi:hypothetical protein
MTKDQFINYPALSASRIKKFYSEDPTAAQLFAFKNGASFHDQLLEHSIDEMDQEALNVYKAIMLHPVASRILDGAQKELPAIKMLLLCGHEITAKCCYDIYNEKLKVVADIKTTSAKDLNTFKADMIKHNNHIQAVWYSLIAGIDPMNFFYIGVNAKSKKMGATEDDIFIYRHTDEEIFAAKELINNYINSEWEIVKPLLGKK